MSRFLSRHSEYVSRGCIKGRLYKISWFPGVVLSDSSSDKVYGTVFKLYDTETTFQVLDEYEGFDVKKPDDSLFIRETTTVILENKTSLTAWVYVYNQAISDAHRIYSGRFLA